MTNFQIQGLDKLNKKLDTLENFQHKMHEPMEKGLSLMHDYIAVAPRKKRGAFTADAKPQQRRWYWWAVRKGIIGHDPNSGYIRTNTIWRKWTTKITNHSSGVTGELGNNALGAIYVQSKEAQQPFHKASGWRTDAETIEKNAKKVQGFFDDVAHREVNR